MIRSNAPVKTSVEKIHWPCQEYGTRVLLLSPYAVSLVGKLAILYGVIIYAPAIHYDTLCCWEMLETASIPNLNRMDE